MNFWNNRILQKSLLNAHQSAYLKKKLLKNSSIIRTNQHADVFLAFFEQQIKDIQLIFRGSEHKFPIASFLQNFGNTQHTVTISETEKG